MPTLEEQVEELKRAFPNTIPPSEAIYAEAHISYHTNQYIPFFKQALLTAEKREREKAVDIINLILPFARGYVAQNNYEANRRYIHIAQDYTYEAESPTQPQDTTEPLAEEDHEK